MKYLLLPFLFISLISAAQNQQPKENVILQGYVFTEDSVPVENAFLINYRTSRIITTDHKGYFKSFVAQGDSLMINHVSLAPKVLYVISSNPGLEKVYVPYRTYILKAISTGNYEKERQNVEESMKEVKKEINQQILIKQTQRTSNVNPYDNDEKNPGITIPIIHLSKPDKKQNQSH